MSGPRITLRLAPSGLGQAFHMQPIRIYAGNAVDFVGVACNCYLLWREEYPTYLPTIEIAGRPAEAAALNQALFGHKP